MFYFLQNVFQMEKTSEKILIYLKLSNRSLRYNNKLLLINCN